MNLATFCIPRLGLAILLAVCSAAAPAQTWEYKSYKKDGPGGQYDPNRYVTGTISVEEKDGKHWFRMVAGAVDVCYRGALPVMVAKTDATTTIEVEQAVSGCEEFRYVINNDGSGGIKEIRRGERWAKSRFDHGLKPVK
jgi:hypothetical protein